MRDVFERVEKRELKGSSLWAGSYLAFFLRRSHTRGDCFGCDDHTDVGWAVGALVYQWLKQHAIPADTVHLTDALFATEDVLLEQELKCWFHVEVVHGKCRARPIVQAFDATSPGRYFSVNDFLMTAPEYRASTDLWLRVCAVLIPAHRCPGPMRELTLRADDGAEVRYRADAAGTYEVTGRSGDTGAGPTLDEIIEHANRPRRPPDDSS